MPDQKRSSDRVALNDGDADQVDHEHASTLHINDEDLSRQGRDGEEERTQKKDLYDRDRKERLQIPPEMIRTDASMVGPGSEGAGEFAKHGSGKRKNGDYATSPPSVRRDRQTSKWAW